MMVITSCYGNSFLNNNRMNKLLILLSILLSLALNANAQRVIDKLDRGVVAVKTTGGVFVSWRIQVTVR